MSLFGGVISLQGISFFLFCVFAVLMTGYALGRITIKGVSLGDAGVFIIALLFGALFCSDLATSTFGIEPVVFEGEWMELLESFGLILFVTSVGFIAGPKFFANMKKNFKSYVLLGAIIIIAGGLAAFGCIMLGEHVFGYGAETITNIDGFVAMIVGLLSGSLTSTPAFSAAKATVAPEYQSLVSVGHGIAYIFGVVGVVLFVQLIPKLTKADMTKERAAIAIKESETAKVKKERTFHFDHMGVCVFSLAAILGTVVGKIKIPMSGAGLSGTCFSLTTTGGCLLVSLLLGHFGGFGKVSLMPAESTLKLFRELGLVLFLVGAGIPGGMDFVANFNGMYFVYGIIMTIVPMILGYLFAKYVLKLKLINSLGSLTGGMTSTPALGTLIGVSGTEDVAAAYAATYPIALIAVVLVSQFLILMF